MREQQEKEAAQQPTNDSGAGKGSPVIHFQTPFPAYQGKSYTAQEVEDTLLDWTPWIVVKKHESPEELIKAAVEKIEKGEVIAWFQGRSGIRK
jgi:predicted NodU family carbamoyl transferase